MNKYSITLLISAVFGLTACNEEKKITDVEQPKTEQVQIEQAQPKTQITIEKQAVNSQQEFAKNAPVISQSQLSSVTPAEQTENKEQEYDKKVEEARKATLDAANKLADVMGTKMEQVTEQLADTISQIDLNKTTEQLADKINEIDMNKVTEPLKKQIDQLGQFMQKFEKNSEQSQQKAPEQQPKTKFEEGYL